MKKLNYYIAFFLFITAGSVLISCQKSTVKPKKTTIDGPIVGYWYGTFLNKNGFGASEGILFRSDGTLKVGYHAVVRCHGNLFGKRKHHYF